MRQVTVPCTAHRRQQGFSLVELAIVLSIMGVIVMAVPTMTGYVKSIFTQAQDDQSMMQGESAITGFILAKNRLPCPDTDDDGVENCSGGAQSGTLPYRTLGLIGPLTTSKGQPIAYSVYRKPDVSSALDADLAVLKDRFQPRLPDGEVSNQENGLDFCWALKNASTETAATQYTYVGSTASPINQAYVLAAPGEADADSNGSLYDGSNTVGSVGFESPSRRKERGYDDTVVSKGFIQLAGELKCPALLGKVNAAARSSYAMYDAKRFMDFTVAYRDMVYNAKEGNKAQAQFNVALAAFDLALVQANMVIGIAAGAESFGALVATLIVPTAAAQALAINGVVEAANGLTQAEEEVDVALARQSEAQAQQVLVDAQYLEQLSDAKALDQKGWLQ